MIGLFRRRALSCEEVMAVLQSHLDGEVDARTARRVARHLEVCDGCAHESAAFLAIKEALVHVQGESADPEIIDRLRSFSHRLIDGEMG